MNSDNYEFSKSSAPQSTSAYSPYVDKQWNYINDINSGVYSNNSGLTLVQWDLTSIYNSAGFSDASDLYLAVPIVMNAALSAAAAGSPILAPSTTAGYSLLSMKSNYQHLIHQIEITCNGKVCEQMQPFISVVKNFQLLSAMSASDLKSMSVSLGLSESLDNERSVVWDTSPAASGTAQCGVGLCNNKAFGTVASTEHQLFQNPQQNAGTVNGAIQKRISRFVDASKLNGASFNGIYGENSTDGQPLTIMSADQLSREYKPYYTVTSTGVMTWTDVGLIPLKYISDFIDKLGLVKKLDLVIRAYFNTGSLSVPVLDGNVATTSYGKIASSTFTNTCPFTINYLSGSQASGGFAAAVGQISAGLFIGRTPNTSVAPANINLNAGNTSHPMAACRCYYSQVKLDPSRALSYVQENAEKQIVYEQVLFNQYSNITNTSSFSQLIQSGIKNPTGVLIIPFISNQCLDIRGAGSAVIGFNQYASPYDTAPSSYAPISLINLQVTLGGVNILNTNLNYTFENFLSQIVNAESLTSSDIGISTGIITAAWWEQNRVYFVDLTRGRSADKEMPRNLNISFNNNSNVPIDIMVFTTYLDKVVINIENGVLRKA